VVVFFFIFVFIFQLLKDFSFFSIIRVFCLMELFFIFQSLELHIIPFIFFGLFRLNSIIHYYRILLWIINLNRFFCDFLWCVGFFWGYKVRIRFLLINTNSFFLLIMIVS
jgi:hypothetical protein